jgi:hypothetical protein
MLQRIGRRAEELSVVSVMPCVRKQGEADRMMFHTPGGTARWAWGTAWGLHHWGPLRASSMCCQSVHLLRH